MKNLIKQPLKHRGFYLRIGFVIALALVILAFQWNAPYEAPEPNYNPLEPYDEIMEPVRTRQSTPKMPDSDQVKKMTDPDSRSHRIEVVPDHNPASKNPSPDFSSRNPDETLPLPEPPDMEERVFLPGMPSEMPVFPGGTEAALQFIADNIEYPEHEQQIGLEGTVYVRFVIDRTGKLGNIQIVRSPSRGFSKEAKRVLRLMPDWEPGRNNGRYVPVYFDLPIRFTQP